MYITNRISLHRPSPPKRTDALARQRRERRARSTAPRADLMEDVNGTVPGQRTSAEFAKRRNSRV